MAQLTKINKSINKTHACTARTALFGFLCLLAWSFALGSLALGCNMFDVEMMDPVTVALGTVAASLAVLYFRQQRQKCPNVLPVPGEIPILGHSIMLAQNQDRLLEWVGVVALCACL